MAAGQGRCAENAGIAGVDRIVVGDAQADLRGQSRADGLGEGGDPGVAEAEIEAVSALQPGQIVIDRLDRRVATRGPGIDVERGAERIADREPVEELILILVEFTSEIARSIARRGEPDFVDEVALDRPTLGQREGEVISVDAARRSSAPEDRASSRESREDALDAIRLREIMLKVVDKLHLMVVGDVEIQANGGETPYVAAWLVEGQIEPVVITVGFNSASERALRGRGVNHGERLRNRRVRRVGVCPAPGAIAG